MRAESSLRALTSSSCIRFPEGWPCGFCGTDSLHHVMGLVHWWLLSVWYQGEMHPLILWMQPRFCSVSAPACYPELFISLKIDRRK